MATRWRRLLAAVADSILAKFGSGRTMELGRSGRTINHAAVGERTELRGHRQRAASQDQRHTINGKIVLRPPKAQTEEPAAKPTERRPARRDK